MVRHIILSFILLLQIATLPAQTDSLFIPSLREVYRLNNWQAGSNPAGLSYNHFRSFSVAEMGYSYRDGNLGNLSIPVSNLIYNVFSESFQTLGKVSLYGKLGYTNNQKRSVSWQGMTGDYWHGLNLCDSVNGNQRTEQYQLSGAFSLPLCQSWLIAARFDYQVALTAKDTDPRNKNQWMEWKLTPGIGYRNDQVRLGASLLYSSRKEAVDYQHVGTHTTYPYLIAYPLGFFKTLQPSQLVSWHYESQEIGGALQAETLQGEYSLFQEVIGSATKQEITSDRVHDKQEGTTHAWQLDYKGLLRKESAFTRHEWKWQATLDHAHTYEPLQRQEGTDRWIKYGEVLRSTYTRENYRLRYRYDQLRDTWNPFYSILVGIDYHREKSDLRFYPLEYEQSIHRLSIHSAFERRIFFSHAHLDCTLGVEYINGGGHQIEEKRLPSDQTSPEIALWQNPERLTQEFNYKTSPRWNIHASVTYTRTESFRWFIQLSEKYEEAYENIAGEKMNFFSIRIGLLF